MLWLRRFISYTLSPRAWHLNLILMFSFPFLSPSFKENMERGEAEQLVRKAIRAGIFNDLGSGSNVDLCVITKVKTAPRWIN